MRGLLWLYPRDWRRRYGAEMEAVLRQMRPGPRELLDLARGAADAHMHPQWRRRAWWGWRWLAAAVAALAAAAASGPIMRETFFALIALKALRVDPTAPYFPPGQWQSVTALVVLCVLVGLLARRLGARLLALFCALLALRFAAEWVVLPVVSGLAPAVPWGVAVGAVAGIWAAFAALVLRRTGRPWPVAIAAGFVLELLFGSSGYSAAGLAEQWRYVPLNVAPLRLFPLHWWNATFWGDDLETLRITLWAATLAARAGVRRRWPRAEPPEGAAVAMPAPDPPQPLEARARRAS